MNVEIVEFFFSVDAAILRVPRSLLLPVDLSEKVDWALRRSNKGEKSTVTVKVGCFFFTVYNWYEMLNLKTIISGHSIHLRPLCARRLSSAGQCRAPVHHLSQGLREGTFFCTVHLNFTFVGPRNLGDASGRQAEARSEGQGSV